MEKKKKEFIFSVGGFCFFVFVVVIVAGCFQMSSWRLLSISEAEKFEGEIVYENVVFLSKKEGVKSAKIIFGIPEDNPFIWVVRLTRSADDNNVTFFRKYSLQFGWLYENSQARGHESEGESINVVEDIKIPKKI